MLFQEDLEGMKCSCPDCNQSGEGVPLVLHSKCHPTEGTWVQYFQGELKIVCAVCETIVTSIAVASNAPCPLENSLHVDN